MSSGDVRESAQPTTMAKGRCVCAVSARLAAFGLPCDTSCVAKRALPSLRLASAASVLTEDVAGSAAKTNAARLNWVKDMISVCLNGLFILVVCVRAITVQKLWA